MGRPFEELAKSLMEEFLSWDPSFATQVGWHRYDRILRDPSHRAAKHIADRCRGLLSDLSNYSAGTLSEEQEIDRDLAIHILRLKIFEIEELRLFERGSLACNEVGYSLFFLFARDHPSFEERLESMIFRLEAIPGFLNASRKVLKSPYRLWNEAALETGKEVPELLRNIERLAEAKGTDPTSRDRLERAIGNSAKAIEAHNKWLAERVIPSSDSRCTIGSDEYDRYFEIKGYGLTTDQALEIGEKYLGLTKKRMIRIASQIVSSGSPEEAMDTMKCDHAKTFEGVLKEYRESVKAAREFVIKEDILTIPENEKLLVLETPLFMRPMFAFAAQFEPGKFDGNRTGMFMVTPDETNPDLLREHSRASIVNTTVHEGYPGHHIQGICANTNPSPIRVLIASPDFGEGWGLYTEDMMISQGYNENPLGRFMTNNDLIFRIVRLIVEIKLAKGDMTLDEATEMLSRECAMESKAAWKEARSCAMTPTYFTAYFLGKLALMQLREDVERTMGPMFSLKFFHDALLYAGCMPMAFMRRSVALRLKQQYGMVLGPQKETLYEYAIRKAKDEAD
jgi:uncharacterized protein (DUF885 family)